MKLAKAKPLLSVTRCAVWLTMTGGEVLQTTSTKARTMIIYPPRGEEFKEFSNVDH